MGLRWTRGFFRNLSFLRHELAIFAADFEYTVTSHMVSQHRAPFLRSQFSGLKAKVFFCLGFFELFRGFSEIWRHFFSETLETALTSPEQETPLPNKNLSPPLPNKAMSGAIYLLLSSMYVVELYRFEIHLHTLACTRGSRCLRMHERSDQGWGEAKSPS